MAGLKALPLAASRRSWRCAGTAVAGDAGLLCLLELFDFSPGGLQRCQRFCGLLAHGLRVCLKHLDARFKVRDVLVLAGCGRECRRAQGRHDCEGD